MKILAAVALLIILPIAEGLMDRLCQPCAPLPIFRSPEIINSLFSFPKEPLNFSSLATISWISTPSSHLADHLCSLTATKLEQATEDISLSFLFLWMNTFSIYSVKYYKTEKGWRAMSETQGFTILGLSWSQFWIVMLILFLIFFIPWAI